MIHERYSRYVRSAITHPGRTLIAATSEVTHKLVPVTFKIEDDEIPVHGILPDAISRYMYLMEGLRTYEPETSHALQHIIKRGDTVFVIGAHIGVHAIQAKNITGVDGVVIAFEPNPDSFTLLQKNCQPRNIIAEPSAISNNGDHHVVLTKFDIRHSAWNTTHQPRSKNFEFWHPETLQVPVTSIDEYCVEKQLTPQIIILDLENGEMDALLGGQNTILGYKPIIIIECGDLGRNSENNTHACLTLLESWGYSLFDMNGSLTPHVIKDEYPDDYPNIAAFP